MIDRYDPRFHYGGANDAPRTFVLDPNLLPPRAVHHRLAVHSDFEAGPAGSDGDFFPPSYQYRLGNRSGTENNSCRQKTRGLFVFELLGLGGGSVAQPGDFSFLEGKVLPGNDIATLYGLRQDRNFLIKLDEGGDEYRPSVSRIAAYAYRNPSRGFAQVTRGIGLQRLQTGG